MFKKPPADTKTTAPLRGSDRRKLKQRIAAEFALVDDDAEVLVPEGLLTQKISTHLNEPGVVYSSPEGDPLWFTLGKGNESGLVPTVYALWKHPTLLPFLSTPSAVIPKLTAGADLMIPGVAQRTPTTLAPNQLVSITQYDRTGLGPPLAVGRMAVSSEALEQANASREADRDVKGKAVYVLHAWRDYLWEMGTNARGDVPSVRAWADVEKKEEGEREEEHGEENGEGGGGEGEILVEDTEKSLRISSPGPVLTPEGSSHSPFSCLTFADAHSLYVSSCLHNALLQALQTTLSSLPPSAFPISASTFWASYILPARPVQPLGAGVPIDVGAIDIKQSTHKSVKVFLKACAKEGLMKLKETKGDVVVTAVYPTHPSVLAHKPHKTVQAVEAKKEKAEERERKEKEAEEKKKSEVHVQELWKPHGQTLGLFVAAEQDTSALYTLASIKEVFTAYVVAHDLVNAHDAQYINVGADAALARAVHVSGADNDSEFMKREDVLRRVRENMQTWHEVRGPRDVVTKKGAVKPISVTVKIRQGRKACTLITGFEGYGLDADDLAEELRKVCASSTAVTPLPGKTTTEMEVMVQGRQLKAVAEFLTAKGVPSKWIKAEDLSASKKKK